jgi:hypothetical protein
VKTIAEEEWAKLPDAIAEAQRHIIDITGKEVAPDVVEVDTARPQCEDLTVVDLYQGSSAPAEKAKVRLWERTSKN